MFQALGATSLAHIAKGNNTMKCTGLVGILIWGAHGIALGVVEGRVVPAPPPGKLAEFRAKDAINTYKLQLAESYRLAGVPAPRIPNLIELDTKIYNAREAGDVNAAQ